jgi:FixJ family two-component response regulator
MSLRKPVVAVVDDDPRLLESIENLLESAGYLARTFASADALVAHGFAGLDVLITDIGLPGTDGFGLRDLARRAQPRLPVFLITGRHEIADQSRAHRSDRFFRKPFDARALLDAVSDALRNQEMEGDDDD